MSFLPSMARWKLRETGVAGVAVALKAQPDINYTTSSRGSNGKETRSVGLTVRSDAVEVDLEIPNVPRLVAELEKAERWKRTGELEE